MLFASYPAQVAMAASCPHLELRYRSLALARHYQAASRKKELLTQF